MLHSGKRKFGSESARAADAPLARRFAAWASGLRQDRIPDNPHRAAERAALDTLGVMAVGSTHPKVKALATSFAGSVGPCRTVAGGPMEAAAAATVNGMAAHVWDFDDTSYAGVLHGSAVILPAVLAVSHEVAADDEASLHAFIIGSEIAYTLGEIAGRNHFLRGWWATGSLALIGAVAGVGRLYGMNADEIANAIGMAAVSAGIERAIAGTDAKPYFCGHVAARAIALARAARAGLTGPVDGFEQPNGFFALLNEGAADLSQADTLGRRWRLETPGLFFKTNPVCSAAHTSIELTRELMMNSGKNASDIVSAHAEVPELVRSSLIFDIPGNAQEAQFSLPYNLACAALHGRVRLEDLSAQAIAASDKLALMAKVTVTEAQDLSEPPNSVNYPESARLTLTFKDGTEARGFCGEAYGMPNRPLSDADLHEKYHSCLSYAGRSTGNEPFPGALTQLTRQSCGFTGQ